MGSKVGWNFPETNRGRETGFNDSGIETFRNAPVSSMTREVLQNSLDARNRELSDEMPVTVSFDMLDLSISELPGAEELLDIHSRCKDYWPNENKAVTFFENAIALLQSKKLLVLKVSDYNTTGLPGNPNARGGGWYNLARASGASGKPADAGGSFGIGKSAAMACSSLRTVFYRSLNLEGFAAQQGVARLVTFLNSRDEPTQGEGFFGKKEKNQPYNADKPLFASTARENVGTDVFIVGFSHPENWEAEVTRAVLEGFFLSIHKRHLSVRVGDTQLTHTSLGKQIEKFSKIVEGGWPTELAYEALVSEDARQFALPDFESLGSAELHLIPHPKGPKKVFMTNRTGMTIWLKGHFRTPVRFAGVFHPSSEELNAFLKSLEPPEHNLWVAARHPDPKYAESLIRKLYKWINERVHELSEQEMADEVDVEGVSQYLPDDDEVLEAAEGDVVMPSQELEPKAVDVSIREPINRQPSPTRSTNSGGGAEGDDFSAGEGDDEGGEGSGSGTNEEDGGMGSEGGGQNAGEGDGGNDSPSDSGASRGAVLKPVQVDRVRAFSLDDGGSTYQVSFTPQLKGEGRVELRAVGESGVDPLDVERATIVGETAAFSIDDKGRIFPVPFVAGQRINLVVKLRNPERVAMEVAGYAD